MDPEDKKAMIKVVMCDNGGYIYMASRKDFFWILCRSTADGGFFALVRTVVAVGCQRQDRRQCTAVK